MNANLCFGKHADPQKEAPRSFEAGRGPRRARQKGYFRRKYPCHRCRHRAHSKPHHLKSKPRAARTRPTHQIMTRRRQIGLGPSLVGHADSIAPAERKKPRLYGAGREIDQEVTLRSSRVPRRGLWCKRDGGHAQGMVAFLCRGPWHCPPLPLKPRQAASSEPEGRLE